jgi:carboxymethylenebutenolidase
MSQGPFGSVVMIHHMPGHDAPTKEIARRFAVEGYNALMPNLYHRDAPGASPDDAAAAARAKGGGPDARLIGDVAGAPRALPAPPRTRALPAPPRTRALPACPRPDSPPPPPQPPHTAWMSQPCRSSCMNATFTSYDPVRTVPE